MSVVAVMMVRDESDIIEHAVRYMATQVDQVRVYDNGSEDGTYHKLLQEAVSLSNLEIFTDREPGYYQSRKMSRWAADALQDGFSWVIPCDADELWYSPDGRTLKQFLEGQAPDVQLVAADLYNHLPSAQDDPDDLNPFTRIQWRQREKAPLPKVAVRMKPHLTIHAGNHGATFSGTGMRVGGLVVRHYSWRSEDQYLKKIRNGYEAYAATDLPDSTGAHWRMWGPDVPDETIRAHFRTWFYTEYPHADATLIRDPAPLYLEGA